MDKKRIIYGILFIVAVLGIGGVILFFNNATENRDKASNTATTLGNKTTETTATVKQQTAKATVTELEDGTLYQIGEPFENVDMVIGDNLFDTQIADININFSQYDGKTIEIEGLYMENNQYTFVGRYSTSNLCPTCPQGVSYFEYEWNGDQKPNLIDAVSWIKVRGTLAGGRDFIEGKFVPYQYIKVNSIEVMNERGIDTVNN